MSSETPQVYTADELEFIGRYASSIQGFVSKLPDLGLLPGANEISVANSNFEKVIAGFIAEEYHDRHETPEDIRLQNIGDFIASIQSFRMASSIAAIDADPTLWDLKDNFSKVLHPALIARRAD